MFGQLEQGISFPLSSLTIVDIDGDTNRFSNQDDYTDARVTLSSSKFTADLIRDGYISISNLPNLSVKDLTNGDDVILWDYQYRSSDFDDTSAEIQIVPPFTGPYFNFTDCNVTILKIHEDMETTPIEFTLNIGYSQGNIPVIIKVNNSSKNYGNDDPDGYGGYKVVYALDPDTEVTDKIGDITVIRQGMGSDEEPGTYYDALDVRVANQGNYNYIVDTGDFTIY